MVCSRNRCNGFTIMLSMRIFQLHATPNNIKIRVLHNNAFTVNSYHRQQRNILRSSYKVPDIFAVFYPNLDLFDTFL